MSFEQVQPFWAHVTAYRLPNSLEMGSFVTSNAEKGVPQRMRVEE